jgi:hypothetical protein
LTGAVVLLALVPSGACLAVSATGGTWGTLGFLVSGAIVAVAMLVAMHAARVGNFAKHRRSAAHVLAQLSVSVTSRGLLMLFDRAGIDAEVAYLIALWVPVIGSACVVELIARDPKQKRSDRESVDLYPRIVDRIRLRS